MLHAQVVNVSMDAVTDEFLTASADGTVRLWTFEPACNGGSRRYPPCVASDLQGLILRRLRMTASSNSTTPASTPGSLHRFPGWICGPRHGKDRA